METVFSVSEVWIIHDVQGMNLKKRYILFVLEYTLISSFPSSPRCNYFNNDASNRIIRYFPNYTLCKDETVLWFKILSPIFKRNSQKLNTGKKEKIVFDIAPCMLDEAMIDCDDGVSSKPSNRMINIIC